MSGVSKPYSELHFSVDSDAATIRCKNWRGPKLAKDATKKIFFY
jgi:hypothetical protein